MFSVAKNTKYIRSYHKLLNPSLTTIIENYIVSIETQTNSLIVIPYENELKQWTVFIESDIHKSTHMFSVASSTSTIMIVMNEGIMLVTFFSGLQCVQRISTCLFSNQGKSLCNLQIYRQEQNVVIVGQKSSSSLHALFYKLIDSGTDIELLTCVNLSVPEPLRKQRNWQYTLNKTQSSLILSLYPAIHEKKPTFTIYKYHLTHILENPIKFDTGENIQIHGQHQFGVVHNYFNVRNVFQFAGCYYILYTRFVPYSKEQQKRINSNVWVVSIGQRYTRQIIDLEGINLKTQLKNSNFIQIWLQQPHTKQKKSFYIKMSPNQYNPNFEIPTQDGVIAQNHKNIFILKTISTKKSSLDSFYYESSIGCQIQCNVKIEKKILYVSLCEAMGVNWESEFIEQVLNLL